MPWLAYERFEVAMDVFGELYLGAVVNRSLVLSDLGVLAPRMAVGEHRTADIGQGHATLGNRRQGLDCPSVGLAADSFPTPLSRPK
jgi:hypothetical protein